MASFLRTSLTSFVQNFVEIKIHDARLRIAELAYVAAEEHGQTGLEHLDTSHLEGVDVDVDVAHSTTTNDVSETIRVQRLRHKTVLLNKVVHHIPLATVRDDITEEVLDKTSFEVFSSSVNDLFQEPVGLLELVPVEEILLRELKTLKVISFHESDSEDICGRKEPAAAA
ncbi:hypothetical protein HG530_002128 [Fusarium avenaceum]|nr:hypothetical protein HG530_002128 [Fusarium avenaceum]